MEQINNYYEFNEQVGTGAQPSPESIRALKEAGFGVIINISPTSTKNYLPEEAKITEELNLKYVHYPIDCSNLQDQHYLTFKALINSFEDEKIFIHCGGNIKSSNLYHMYQVLENKIPENESLKQLKKIQQPELKWIRYFKAFGMQGLN